MTTQLHPQLIALLGEIDDLPPALWAMPLEYQMGYLAGQRELWLDVVAGGPPRRVWQRQVMLCNVAVHLLIRQQQGRLDQ